MRDVSEKTTNVTGLTTETMIGKERVVDILGVAHELVSSGSTMLKINMFPDLLLFSDNTNKEHCVIKVYDDVVVALDRDVDTDIVTMIYAVNNGTETVKLDHSEYSLFATFIYALTR